MISELDQRGYTIVAGILDDAIVEAFRRAFAEVEARTGSQIHALRNLLRKIPAVRELATCKSVRNLVQPVLGNDCFAVRAIFFDKLPGANWKVPWHQDLSIAVAERREVEGFGPWSIKDGVHHAHAPTVVLEGMVTVRLHLDDCDVSNGPLRVMAATHRYGKLNGQQISETVSQRAETVCEVAQGGAMLMRPLLLHASSAATSPGHRRVIHIEFAGAPLPGGLQWHDGV